MIHANGVRIFAMMGIVATFLVRLHSAATAQERREDALSTLKATMRARDVIRQKWNRAMSKRCDSAQSGDVCASALSVRPRRHTFTGGFALNPPTLSKASGEVGHTHFCVPEGNSIFESVPVSCHDPPDHHTVYGGMNENRLSTDAHTRATVDTMAVGGVAMKSDAAACVSSAAVVIALIAALDIALVADFFLVEANPLFPYVYCFLVLLLSCHVDRSLLCIALGLAGLIYIQTIRVFGSAPGGFLWNAVHPGMATVAASTH
eukprot:Opistho-2@3497